MGRYDKMTDQELQDEMRRIENDPQNQNTDGGIWLYSESARKKLDAIAMEINERMIERKRAAGTYVFTGGYSGRQSNKR